MKEFTWVTWLKVLYGDIWPCRRLCWHDWCFRATERCIRSRCWKHEGDA